MNGTNLIKIAVRALANNKLRGFLTMLGIIIGVASVITMLAIGQGSKRSIQAQISEMGSNMIMIHPGADVRGGVPAGCLRDGNPETTGLRRHCGRNTPLSRPFLLPSTAAGRRSTAPTTPRPRSTASVPTIWRYGATKSRTATCSPNRTSRQPPKYA